MPGPISPSSQPRPGGPRQIECGGTNGISICCRPVSFRCPVCVVRVQRCGACGGLSPNHYLSLSPRGGRGGMSLGGWRLE